MVEITQTNGLQVRKIKCKFDYRIRRWGWGCQCCRRKFGKGQLRYQWRLTVPFQKPWTWGNGRFYFQRGLSNWTTHCRSCFILTTKALEQNLKDSLHIATL